MTIYCTNKYFNDPLAKKKKKTKKQKLQSRKENYYKGFTLSKTI